MTSRAQSRTFVAAALALWLLFVIQALQSSLLLDDWFELRYWRDHAFGPTALWQFARFNYFHYNPRIGEVFLALIHGARAVHVIVTPVVQLALIPLVFAIAFARWPRRDLRDLGLLIVIQVLIWLVIPIPGIMYFYRPFATNYLWGFTVTLALVVPYRLALASPPTTKNRPWLVPIMLALGWMAGMCNEHTGPTTMVAIAAFVVAAAKARRLRAWMVAGLAGLYVGYPMLFFAPGQTVRYAGLATRDTPVKLLAERGLTGCFAIVGDFLYESRLGLLLFGATAVSYALTHRFTRPTRGLLVETGALVAAAIAIVVTLFVSPTTTDRVFFASGVLLVAACAPWMELMFAAGTVRRFTVGACVIAFGYHVVRFVQTSAAAAAENDERIALLASAAPGSIVVVRTYDHPRRSRWQLGDDFQWTRDYVASELYDLGRIDLDARDPAPGPHLVAVRSYEPPLAPRHALTNLPTYRDLLAAPLEVWLAAQLVGQRDHTLTELALLQDDLFVDPRHRPFYVLDWTPGHTELVQGRPYDDARGHFIRVRNPPPRLADVFITGCGYTQRVELRGDLVPVDERFCRGAFTAILCDPERCWVAGWY